MSSTVAIMEKTFTFNRLSLQKLLSSRMPRMERIATLRCGMCGVRGSAAALRVGDGGCDGGCYTAFVQMTWQTPSRCSVNHSDGEKGSGTSKVTSNSPTGSVS